MSILYIIDSYEIYSLLCKLDIFLAIQQILLIIIKWYCLQKRVRKFAQKKFYDIDPRCVPAELQVCEISSCGEIYRLIGVENRIVEGRDVVSRFVVHGGERIATIPGPNVIKLHNRRNSTIFVIS
jgi:hypothetical protein